MTCVGRSFAGSVPGITPKQLVLLDKLAQTVVFTSQGIHLSMQERRSCVIRKEFTIALKVLTLLTPLIGG
jgi:predicted alpha/beta hydrolase